MQKIEYDLPIFEDNDVADLNDYSIKMATALKEQIDKFGNPLIFRGAVQTLADLQALANAQSGYIYRVDEENKNYIYNGTDWVVYSDNVDLSKYQEEVNTQINEVNTQITNIEQEGIIVSPTEPTENRRKVWLQKGKNLFDKLSHIEFNDGYRSWQDGKKRAVANFCGLKIPVYENTQYVTSSDIIYTEISNLCFFDKNMNFISGYTFNTEDRSFITPSSCAYITIAILNTYDYFQLQQGSTATEYEEYVEPKTYILNDNNVYEEFMKKEEEIYSTNEQVIGKWIDGKTLYRKVINIGELIPNSRTDYSTGISNVKIKKFEAYFEALDNVFKLNHVNNYNKSSNEHESIALYTTLNGTSIRVENANVSATNLNCWVILEYTKISD